jgi:ABC-type Fe3+-hydroxamate transport system substrate-binding protein
MTATQVKSDSRAKFVELAGKRVTNALKAIRLIGNLSNRASYDYSKEDIAKIFAALNEEINSVRQRFEQPKDNRERSFSIE